MDESFLDRQGAKAEERLRSMPRGSLGPAARTLLSASNPGAFLRCPHDTNGDGDCGKAYCPWCGTKTVERTIDSAVWWIEKWFERNLTHGDPVRVACKMGSEVGEVQDAVLGEHGEDLTDLVEEIGDVLVCSIILLNLKSPDQPITLQTVLHRVVAKLNEREIAKNG